ncbi:MULTISPECIES: DUF6896 domain-containing protein [Pseudoalteromonas]|uniref:DUF6896 domain-containing protein n=1 Tax=Pseudoalteromonas TaxID=53246 RepID=UPI001891A532|nr:MULTISPECIES: hypothetical protein [Pseudoalteromonas]MEC4091932.1 hypothetical protein [Pseudoalteromonas rubra]
MSLLIADIKAFISTQRKLTRALLNEYPECTNYSLLINLPKYGRIKVDDMYWNFKKHGAGVEFSCVDDGRLVDVCEHIDQPDLFDEWRLSLYLESIHKEDCNLKGELAGLRQSGQVLSNNEYPRLLLLAQ